MVWHLPLKPAEQSSTCLGTQIGHSVPRGHVIKSTLRTPAGDRHWNKLLGLLLLDFFPQGFKPNHPEVVHLLVSPGVVTKRS